MVALIFLANWARTSIFGGINPFMLSCRITRCSPSAAVVAAGPEKDMCRVCLRGCVCDWLCEDTRFTVIFSYLW